MSTKRIWLSEFSKTKDSVVVWLPLKSRGEDEKLVGRIPIAKILNSSFKRLIKRKPK